MNRTKARIDLENRTMAFGLMTLKMLREVPAGVEFKSIRRQLTRSATAIGVLYRAANLEESRLDYVAKIAAVRKEIAESEYWLSLIRSLQADIPGVIVIHQEAVALKEIFDRLRRTAEKGSK